MVRANKNLLIFALAISSCFTFACAAKAEDTPKLKDALPSVTSDRKIPTDITPEKVRKTKWLAYRLAKYEWFEKLAEADPRIVAAVCAHPGPAKILAKHRHLDKIAEADHYLCRRLCRWKGSTDKLVRSPYRARVGGHVFCYESQPCLCQSHGATNHDLGCCRQRSRYAGRDAKAHEIAENAAF